MIATFDIGGTFIKCGLIDNNGVIIEKSQIPTYASQGGLFIINRIIEIIHKMQEKVIVTGVAMSSAGIIDPYLGIVLSTTDTMTNYAGTNIKQLIESATNIFTTVENDVNCAALAEAYYSKPPLTDFLAMTIGTGIGGAIVINQQIFHGSSFSAGEWGRLMIDGKPYEKQASITSLVEHAIRLGLKVEHGLDVFNLYDQHNLLATEVVEHFYNRLSTGLVNLIYSFNPKVIVIGGGISHRGEKFIQELYQHLEKQLDPFYMKSVILRLATMKNDSGMLGAYRHHLNLTKK